MVIQVVQLFFIELRRYLKKTWSYRMDTVGDFLTWLVTFPVLLMLFQGVSTGFGVEAQTRSLVGFLVWTLCMGVLSATARELSQEMREGTLEPFLLAPVAPLLLISFRVLAMFVYRGLYTLVLGGVLAILLRLPMNLTMEAALLILLTVAGAFGVSLCIGGLTLVYKAVSSLIGVVSLLAVLATGALVPLNSLGAWFTLLKVATPITWGIDAIRIAMIDGANWRLLWLDGTWLGLTLQSMAFLGLGIILFRWGLKRARVAGTLGSY
ncbi:hypothetical protein GC175_28795 [bacterium]|nr:hypothetical protein [bacterium]